MISDSAIVVLDWIFIRNGVRTLEETSVVICSVGYSSVSVVETLEGTLVEMLSLDAILT